MAKSIPALVTPEVLVWARNLDGITIQEIALKLKVGVERVEEWESGVSHPTLVQAKEMAKQYRVPFVYFYLPDAPRKIKRIEKTDYRTFGNNGALFEMSRELKWLLRDIEERRDTIMRLFEEDSHITKRIPFEIPSNATDEEIALKIRRFLELDNGSQNTFRKAEVAYSHCISVLEKYDILVFQAAKVEPSEMRGLSVAYSEVPIIVTNRKDEPAARLFTLCHELVHIVTNTSGLCNDISNNVNSKFEIELRCNRIAGLILLPEDEVKSNKAIEQIQKYGFDDTYMRAIARDFAVSKEVVLHRLWEIGIVDKSFYYETLKRYSNEYLEYKSKQKKGFLPPVIDTGTQVGRLYAQTVLNAYNTEKISARDTSNFLLNLKAKNFSKLERWCF